MTSKLTLTVEKSVIEKAKSYAKKTGQSLSELIDKSLDTINSEENGDKELYPRIKKIVGAFTLPNDFNEEKELSSYFEKKHL